MGPVRAAGTALAPVSQAKAFNPGNDMSLKTMAERRAWSLVAMGTAAAAGYAARKLLDAGWQFVQDEEPPENPAGRGVGWGQAVAWTVATSVAMGLAQLLAQRGAAAGWRQVRGHYPEELE